MMTVIVTDLLSRLGGKIWKVFGKSWLWSFRNIWLIWELLPISENWCNHYLRIVIVRRGGLYPDFESFFQAFQFITKSDRRFFYSDSDFSAHMKVSNFFQFVCRSRPNFDFFLRFCHPLFVNPSSQFTILTKVLITSSFIVPPTFTVRRAWRRPR